MVNPGILPLSIVRGTNFEGAVLFCKDENVTVDGVLTPDVTGVYVPCGTFNGYDLFILEGAPSTFLYVHPFANTYIIAQQLSTDTFPDFWILPGSVDDPTGDYTPSGAFTGTASVSDHPVDLTGYTAQAHGRRSPGAPELIVNFNPSITNPTNGEITIPEIVQEDTAELPYVGNFVWDLVLTNGSVNRFGPFIKGPLLISDNVTAPVL